MTVSHQHPTAEEEFDQIHSFLTSELPRLFNSGAAKEGAFFVSEELDDDHIASFLMTFDEYNSAIPPAIQQFIRSLHYDWTVFGCFDILSPFNPDGSVNRSPRFAVTRATVTGDFDPPSIKQRFGDQLKASPC